MSPWKAKAERGNTWLIQLIAWLARTVGRPLCRLLLNPIVLYFVLADGSARRASREFLGAALGRPPRWTEVFEHIHCFAATLLDRVYMARGEFERFQVTIEGQELVREALKAGRGCVLLGSHLGSFDLMMLASQALDDQPITVLMHIDPRSRLRRIAGIDDSRLNVIALGQPESFLRAYAVLEAGGVVALLADRVDGAACLTSSFFGRQAEFPIGPHTLAARAGAPVVMCFGVYQGRTEYRIEFVEFGVSAPRDSRGSALQPVVDHYAGLLETYARRYPMNWFNFYPYWSRR